MCGAIQTLSVHNEIIKVVPICHTTVGVCGVPRVILRRRRCYDTVSNNCTQSYPKQFNRANEHRCGVQIVQLKHSSSDIPALVDVIGWFASVDGIPSEEIPLCSYRK